MNFQKTSIRSYLGSITEKERKHFFDLAQNFFPFRVVLGLRGKIVPPPIRAQSKIFFVKSKYFDITNKEKTQIPKSESKKFSILCTFKSFQQKGT